MVVNKAKRGISFPGLKEKRLPKVPEDMELEKLDLEVRTYNCLQKAIRRGTLKGLQALSEMTVADVMRLPGFGAKCLVDLLTSIESVTTSMGVSVPPGLPIDQRAVDGKRPSEVVQVKQFGGLDSDLDREAHKLRKAPLAKEVRCNDPRVAREIRYALRAVNSLGGGGRLRTESTIEELTSRILDREKDPSNAKELARHLRLLHKRLRGLARAALENELLEIAGLVTWNARDKAIFMRRFGFDGRGGSTLQEIADELGMTREGIRQITSKSEAQLKRREILTPALDRALEFVARQVPRSADEIEAGLTTSGVTKGRFRLEGLLNGGKLFGRKATFILATDKGTRFAVPAYGANLTRVINQVARRTITRWGVATIADVGEQVREKTGKTVKPNFVIQTLKSAKDFVWLDQSSGWFWLRSVPRNSVLSRVKKILSVTTSINVSELRAGISRHHRMRGFAPPRRVLLELCRQTSACRVDNDVVAGESTLVWHETLKGVERTMVKILKEEGPIIERNQFEKLCRDRGIKAATFSMYLFSSPVIARFGPGVYGLAGANVTPGQIESLIPDRHPRQVLQDYGWTSQGKPWLCFTLSGNMLASGTFTVPASMKDFISGEFKLRVEDGSTIGKLICKESGAWGLGPFYRRRGGEQGDCLMIVFDLAAREAVVRVGDLALVEAVQLPSTT
jgi:hypothetical protein